MTSISEIFGRGWLAAALATGIIVAACGGAPAPAPMAEPAPAATVATAAPEMPADSAPRAASDFELTDIKGKAHKLSQYKDSYVVLEWINHGCPFVKKHYGAGNMQKLQSDWTAKGVVWLSICSSAPGKQGSMTASEWTKKIEEDGGKATAVLLDINGAVGKMYDARTTPHMFVVAPGAKIVYEGAIDDKSGTDPAEIATARNHVAAALEESMAGKPVTIARSEPYGCSVKY